MTINNKSERNYRGNCLGWPVTSYGAGMRFWRILTTEFVGFFLQSLGLRFGLNFNISKLVCYELIGMQTRLQ